MTEDNTNEPVVEISEDYELSDADEADLKRLLSEDVEYHTLLEVWREVLKPAAVEATKRVTPQWAMRMVQSYPQLTVQDTIELRDRFYAKIQDLAKILDAEIETDSDALSRTTQETDAADNREHYLNLLLNWQKQILQWELDWDCTDPQAHIEVAAISETHKMFFAREGLTGFLDNIGFEFDEDDGQIIADALEELKEDHE